MSSQSISGVQMLCYNERVPIFEFLSRLARDFVLELV
ncbi:MAG: hypothetical protein J07HQW2_01263 [Haloquadratum walsbyi J07HQW2]|uniref:Uncharacterized protein n=1 Tax=Haloquadratum walsbyi J07HQW2 TaxID=1238425 RepID=U1PR62_9EURY|nr:MAG: hypothetical protein J07HQW2_01263 [Haloquadratum walsbyi J07HQW2]